MIPQEFKDKVSKKASAGIINTFELYKRQMPLDAVLKVVDEAAELYAESKEQKWISVKERLPEKNKRVLCFDGFRMMGNSYSSYSDQDEEWFKRSFTHWMPLPNPPEFKP